MKFKIEFISGKLKNILNIMKFVKRNFTVYTKDYYQIFGVPKSASLVEIKKRYTSLVKEHHPDVNISNANLFKEIIEAYAVLNKPEERRKYDAIVARYGIRRESDQEDSKRSSQGRSEHVKLTVS